MSNPWKEILEGTPITLFAGVILQADKLFESISISIKVLVAVFALAAAFYSLKADLSILQHDLDDKSKCCERVREDINRLENFHFERDKK